MRRISRLVSGASYKGSLDVARRDLTGKVKNWKHYSGFGFIFGDDKLEYFTTRQNLGGGFFLNEGQQVQFDPTKSDPTKSPIATNVTNADGSPITPIEIAGVVTQIDKLANKGVITELDVRGNTHPSSPTFAFSADSVESTNGVQIGSHVRFALDGNGTPIRIISRQLQVAKKSGGNFRSGAVAPPHNHSQAQSGGIYKGTVRDVRETYGFIACHASNQSIFFHMRDVVGDPVAVGDFVSFLRVEDSSAKNRGKPRATGVTKASEI